MVEYTPGYIADHWCKRGHVLLVLEGELVTELEDGRKFTLLSGMSYQVGEDANPHRSHTEKGAKLFLWTDHICAISMIQGLQVKSTSHYDYIYHRKFIGHILIWGGNNLYGAYIYKDRKVVKK